MTASEASILVSPSHLTTCQELGEKLTSIWNKDGPGEMGTDANYSIDLLHLFVCLIVGGGRSL